MKSFAFALTLGTVSAIGQAELEFLNYLATHGKIISSIEEFESRFKNYQATDFMINMINSSQTSWVAGHNKFSDWTNEEYKKMLGVIPATEILEETYFDESNTPSSVNWVQQGAVTGVKDQGQCGSCWAFSSTGSLEGAHFLASGKLESFSEQQLVECSTRDAGCNGGNPLNAFKYYESHYAELESDYPYTSSHGRSGSCKYDTHQKTNTEVSSYGSVRRNSVSQMKAALAKQPISVLVEADRNAWQSYRSGILNTTACGTSLDHAVLAVGYGSEGGQEYWLVKNSWGTSWGESGYIRLAIVDGKGICGVQEGPTHASSN